LTSTGLRPGFLDKFDRRGIEWPAEFDTRRTLAAAGGRG
jgi:hypothetical protein